VIISINDDRAIMATAIFLYLSPQGLYPPASLRNLPFSLSLRMNAQQAKNSDTELSDHVNTLNKEDVGCTDESDMTPPTTSTYPVCPSSLHSDPRSMISILHEITFPKQRNKVPPHHPLDNSKTPSTSKQVLWNSPSSVAIEPSCLRSSETETVMSLV